LSLWPSLKNSVKGACREKGVPEGERGESGLLGRGGVKQKKKKKKKNKKKKNKTTTTKKKKEKKIKTQNTTKKTKRK